MAKYSQILRVVGQRSAIVVTRVGLVYTIGLPLAGNVSVLTLKR